MRDDNTSLTHIERFIEQMAARAQCTVIAWRRDPGDPRHVFVTARPWCLPPEATSIQLEVWLPLSASSWLHELSASCLSPFAARPLSLGAAQHASPP